MKTCGWFVILLLFLLVCNCPFSAATHPFLHAYPVLISPRSNHHSQNGSVAGAQPADPGTTALGLNAALTLSSCVPSAGVASWSLYSFFCKMEFIVAPLKPWRENGDFVGNPLARGSTVSVESCHDISSPESRALGVPKAASATCGESFWNSISCISFFLIRVHWPW